MSGKRQVDLEGQADPETLARLLCNLGNERATGVLSLGDETGLRKLYMYEGLCCSLQSSIRGDDLGPILVQVGWLSDRGLEKVNARTGKTRPTSGELMLALKPADLGEGRDLRDALRLQLQVAAASTFAKRQVPYSFDSFPQDLPTSAGLEVDPLGIMVEGIHSYAAVEDVDAILAPFAQTPVTVSNLAPEMADVLRDFFGQPLFDHVTSATRRPAETAMAWPNPELAKRLLATLSIIGSLGAPGAGAPAPEVHPPEVMTGRVAITPPGPDVPGAVLTPSPQIVEQRAFDVQELVPLLSRNHFELLGVGEDAPTDVVKDAAKALLARFDPRAAQTATADVRDLVGKVANRIREAQITLLHPEVRREYINSLARQTPVARGAVAAGPSTGMALAPASAPAPPQHPALADAKAAEAIGDWMKAREALSVAIDALPQDAELHARMGWVTYKCREIDQAERERLFTHHLNYALELNPNLALAHHHWGTIYTNQGNPVRARMAFEAALRVDPTHKGAKEALDRLGKPQRAEVREERRSKWAPKKKQGANVVALAVLLGFASIPLIISTVSRHTSRFEIEPDSIGLDLPAAEIRQQNETLVVQIELGAWSSLPDAEQLRRVEDMGKKAADLGKGIREIIVFDAGRLCAQYSGGVAELFK